MSKLISDDVLIVGGGIIGLLTARELIHAGASVTLIDKDETGKEASWAAGGILSPLYPWRYPTSVNILANWSKNHYPTLAEKLKTETGIDPQWKKSGLLILDTLSLEEQNIASEWAKATNNKFKLLTYNDLWLSESTLEPELEPGLEPELNKCFTHGMQLPEVAQIRNPRLVKALKKSLLDAGTNIIENTEVTKILVQKNRCTCVATVTRNYTAEKIVIASGAWSTPLLAKANVQIDVKPMRGQMILINATPGLVSNIILHDNQYMIPRCDGRTLIGSTLEDVGFDKSTTESAKKSLWQTAIKLIPAVSRFSIEHHWAGLRPGSSQGIPIISQHPIINNLYINTGHFRNGVILGPASARLLVDIMTGSRTIMDPKPYALG